VDDDDPMKAAGREIAAAAPAVATGVAVAREPRLSAKPSGGSRRPGVWRFTPRLVLGGERRRACAGATSLTEMGISSGRPRWVWCKAREPTWS
jgi:hypothetical protein